MPTKIILITLLLIGLALPVWAGSEMKVQLESTSHKYAWVNVDVLIEGGQLRLNFQGPWSRGSLIYDKTTSGMIIVDDINKIVLPINSTTQTAFKMMGRVASGGIKGQMEGALPSVKMAYHLVEVNAQALFNGDSVLKRKNFPMDGFKCDLYETDSEGKKNREVWMTPLKATGMNSDDYQTLWSLVEQVVDLLGSELKQLGADTGPFLGSYSNLQIPIHAGLFVNNKLSCRFKVIKIQSRTMDSGTFDPPADYQTLSLLEMIKQGIKSNS
jgi:hypothetical protein